jgi:cytidylate kinase
MEQTDKIIKISVTGDLGSGKSTVCRYLSQTLNFKLYSIGQIQRSLAQKYNMSIHEFNIYMETHPEIDEEIDTELTLIGKRRENMILDSRMAWHFVPDSFKVYLSVNPEAAAKRVLKDNRGAVESYENLEEAKTALIERKQSENLRYITKYGVDCSKPQNFDLIIDTTNITPKQTAEIILSHLK